MEDHAVVPERIFDAACDGKLEEVREFLAGAAAPQDVVNCIDQAAIGSNGTLLSCVTFGRPFTAGHVKLVRRLISLGADVNHIETDRSSPLFNVLHSYGPDCSEEAVLSMIKLLLRAGANVHAPLTVCAPYR